MDECSNNECRAPVPLNVRLCPTCGHDVGYPNVRYATQPAERAALDERYRAARDAAAKRGANATFSGFEEAVRTRSRAVITVGADLLWSLFESDTPLYANYERQVGAALRLPAAPEHDHDRCIVAGALFGSFAPEISYAALSLDGKGLTSYGRRSNRTALCTIVLGDFAIRSRASLLEENSFSFVTRHRLSVGIPIPAGYRATWEDRHLLAVAKLADRLNPGTAEARFSGLLLSTEGDRETDEFVEVYIYGPFNRRAIDDIIEQVPGRTESERIDIDRARDTLAALRKT